MEADLINRKAGACVCVCACVRVYVCVCVRAPQEAQHDVNLPLNAFIALLFLFSSPRDACAHTCCLKELPSPHKYMYSHTYTQFPTESLQALRNNQAAGRQPLRKALVGKFCKTCRVMCACYVKMSCFQQVESAIAQSTGGLRVQGKKWIEQNRIN